MSRANNQLGQCSNRYPGSPRCDRAAVAYADGFNLCSRHLDEYNATKDFAAWLRDLLDGSIRFTGRNAVIHS